MRAVLAFLGVEYSAQPSKLGDLKFLLKQYERLECDNYNKAIDVIINGEKERDPVPEQYKDQEDFIKQRSEHYENKLVSDFIEKGTEVLISTKEEFERKLSNLDDRSATAIIKLSDDSGKALQAVTERAEVVWREEAKKHRKIVIERHDSKELIPLEGVLPDEFADMLELCDERENVMMVGPAGAGKTYLAGQLAKALGLRFASQSCSAGISESVFSGWLLPTGDNARFNHVASPFLDMYENGGLFLFDEMDAADANVLTFLNQALANNGFDLPQRFEKTRVTKHKDFVAVSACNTFGQGADAMYHARNALDAATLDRFKMGMTTIDYSAPVEEALIHAEVLRWGRSVRTAINKNNLKRIMSTRTMMGATKMHIGKKWPIRKIAMKYFQDWSKEEIAIMKSLNVNVGNEDWRNQMDMGQQEPPPKVSPTGRTIGNSPPAQDLPWNRGDKMQDNKKLPW